MVARTHHDNDNTCPSCRLAELLYVLLKHETESPAEGLGVIIRVLVIMIIKNFEKEKTTDTPLSYCEEIVFGRIAELLKAYEEYEHGKPKHH